ncbi:alkylated DNA nucleotide flippase Atl1 [Anaerotaenia torta]
MSKVPAGRNLPCHRVVNRMGDMASNHVFDGEQLQRTLLEKE